MRKKLVKDRQTVMASMNARATLLWLVSLLVMTSCISTPPTIRLAEVIPQQSSSSTAVETLFPVKIERFGDARANNRTIGVRARLLSGLEDILADGDIASAFETVVTRQLEQKGIRSGPSIFNLRGTVEGAFVSSTTSDEWNADVVVELILYNSETKAVVWSGTYSGKATDKDSQRTLARSFQDLAASIDRDSSILRLKDVYLASLKVKEQGRQTARQKESTTPSIGETLTAKPSDVIDVDSVPVGHNRPRSNTFAIVIGIEQYREKLPKADFADRDAKLVGEYLTKFLGYPEENVVVRTNEKASLTDLRKYIENWLPNNVEKDSSVFIYYSGHGAPNPKTGDAYLVPYDGDPSFIETTAYPLKQLYAAIDKLPAKDITVVLDSCFSGAGGRSVIGRGMRPMVLTLENQVMAGGKTVVLAASQGDQVSSTYEGKRHGLLTYYFLKGLQGDGDLNKDGVIDMAELYEYVKPNVQRIARKQFNNEQTPQLFASPEVLRKGGGKLVDSARP